MVALNVMHPIKMVPIGWEQQTAACLQSDRLLGIVYCEPALSSTNAIAFDHAVRR